MSAAALLAVLVELLRILCSGIAGVVPSLVFVADILQRSLADLVLPQLFQFRKQSCLGMCMIFVSRYFF